MPALLIVRRDRAGNYEGRPLAIALAPLKLALHYRAMVNMRGLLRCAPLLAVAITASCGDSGTGPPPDVTCATATVPLCNDAAWASATRDALTDAIDRVAPALENSTSRGALLSNLAELRAAVIAGNVTRSSVALKATREQLVRGRNQLTTFGGDAADLTVIELATDQVAELIGVD